jgi:capsular polysaccharide biosynthesis protein
MQIKDYVNLLLRRGWIIILVAAATTVGAYAVSKLQTPIFRSTIKISVSPARSDYGLSLTIQNVLRNYAAQLKTRRMAQAVIDNLKLDITPEIFLSELAIAAQLDNNLIQVDVDDPDPNRAQFIANVLARLFVEDQTAKQADIDRLNRLDVAILDDALPGELNRPKTKTNVLAGGILGLFLGGLIVLAIEYLDDTLKTAEDVDRFVGLTTLGTIPMLSPAGKPAKAPVAKGGTPL